MPALKLSLGLAIVVLVAATRLTDGDSLVVDGERIRLHGVDSPELAQTCRRDGRKWACGEDAAAALRRFVGTAEPDCRAVDQDRYGRTVARCYVNGRDLGALMVQSGWALAYRKYSVEYVPLEDEARQARRGLWSSEFIPPWQWRAAHRR